MKILYGTTNKAKLQAMRTALKSFDVELIGLGDIDSALPNIDENGKTPLENAEIKAKAYYDAFRIPVFSCDSGLYFDELQEDEQPGLHVRRIGGKELTDDEMQEYYASLAAKHGGRITGRYRNAIYFILDDEHHYSSMDMSIATEPFILVTKPHPKRVEGFPLDSLSVDIETGKYYYDLDVKDVSTSVDDGVRAFFGAIENLELVEVPMKINCIWEHNGNDTLLYAEDYVGAFTRGENVDVALQKMQRELQSYLAWINETIINDIEPVIVQEKDSELDIKDADSDILFSSEEEPLTMEEYIKLRDLALKSAADFLKLYEAIPNKNVSVLPMRKTFYGQVPRTAEEMYLHTKNVNSYYFGEIGIEADNEGTVFECRRRGFEQLEDAMNFLNGRLQEGSYGEMWSVRKVLRRFIWHDRIHAKAMWKMAKKTFEESEIEDVFFFD